MTNSPQKSADNILRSEAAAWIAQLETGDLSGGDITALKEWVNRSPQHKMELQKLAKLWGMLDEPPLLRELLDQNHAQQRHMTSSPVRKKSVRKIFWTTATGVCAAICLMLAISFYQTSLMQEDRQIMTAVGQIETIDLKDGSVISINTDTQLDISFSAKERRIRMLSGEAIFEVAHDEKRPFLVHVGKNQIRAVGTAFAIRIDQQDMRLTVTDGRVEMAKTLNDAPSDNDNTSQAPQPIAILLKGQSVEMKDDVLGAISSLEQDQIDRKLSWQKGVLEFAGEPLQHVVTELTRYTSISFEIADEDLASLPVGGVFRIGETDKLLEVLEQSFGIKVSQTNPNKIQLSRSEI